MLSEEAVARCLAEEWGLPEARVTRLDGGMGSRTWIVDDAGRRWVLKAGAPALGGQMAGGLAVAQRLDLAGIPAGAPEPTRAGELTATVSGCRLGLLAWVPGRPLTRGDHPVDAYRHGQAEARGDRRVSLNPQEKKKN